MDYDLSKPLGFFVTKAHLLMRNNLQKKFKEYDMTQDQWMILNRLSGKDGCTQMELAKKTYKDKATITRMLDTLEKMGLVRRESIPDDRRVFLIYVTEEGKRIQESLIPLAREASEEAVKGLSADEVEELKRLLVKVISNFDMEENR